MTRATESSAESDREPRGTKEKESPAAGWGRRNRARSKSSLFAAGEPMVWLTGGALAVCALMVAGLLLLVLARGLSTFWPRAIVKMETPDGRVFMGEVTREDSYRPTQNVLEGLEGPIASNAERELEASGGFAFRELLRTGNFRLTQNHFSWVSAWEVAERSEPEWAMLVERMEWGVFYGFPEALVELTPVTSAEEALAVASGLKPEAGGEILYLDGESSLVKSPEEASSLRAVAVAYRGAEA
ncbi:MAG: hypothetical protein AAF725_25825, partial [Acidobacteriota bacterium]